MAPPASDAKLPERVVLVSVIAFVAKP